MKSDSLFSASLFVVLFLLSGQAMSQPNKEPTTAQVIAAARENVKDKKVTLYFEAIMEGKPIGFGMSTLSPTGSGQTRSFQYRTEMVFNLEGVRIEGSVSATLNLSFEPTEVEVRRDVTAPNGNRQSTVERADILDKEILLTREADGGARTQRNVSRPDAPFVLAIEFIVRQIDLKRFPAFALREFDPQEGNVIVQQFRAEVESGGIRRLVSREDDGSIGYLFEIDAKGELLSWAEPPLPVVNKQCLRERFEELRKSLHGR